MTMDEKCGRCADSELEPCLLRGILQSQITMSDGSGDEGAAGRVDSWVPLSDEARLVLFFGGARRARFEWAKNKVDDILSATRPISAEEARAVAVKSWTGDARMSCRFGRDLAPSQTPLRVLLDCTDVMLVVADYLRVREERDEENVEACMCLGAFGGHRALVEVASSVLYGTVGVAQRRLAAKCEAKGLAWWVGAGGEATLFREVVWGLGGAEGMEGTGTGASSSSLLPSDVVLSAVGGAAYGGLLDDCRRGLGMLRGEKASELRRMGVVELLLGGAGGGHVQVLDAAVGLLEEEGMDVNDAKDGWSMTALHWAASNGHASVVERLAVLFGDRLDVNARSRELGTPLHWAAWKGRALVVERLVELFGERLDVNARDRENRTALHWAAANGRAVTVEALVSLLGDRLDLNAADRDGNVALALAAENGHAPVVEKLLTLCGDRLDVNAKDRAKRTALHKAALHGRGSVVERLLTLCGDRLDVNAKDRSGMTALQRAGWKGRASVVELLVSLLGDRLDIHAKDGQGRTALHWAAVEGRASVVEKLVSLFGDRMDVNAKDSSGKSAEALASKPSIARFLASIRQRNPADVPPTPPAL